MAQTVNGDRRRTPGPAETFQPVYVQQQQHGSKVPGVLSAVGKRKDGRVAEGFRDVFTKTGSVPQANGSAYIEMDKTKVICAVYGPRQAQKTQQFSEQGQLQCSLKFAPFASSERRALVRDPEELELSRFLEQALTGAVRLETFPKAVVDVYVTVLEDDGAALAAAINVASLALADAGVEMTDLVAACSAGLLRDQVIVDCTKAEEKQLSAHLIVAHQPSLNESTYVGLIGEVPPASVTKAVELCVDGAAKVYSIMQECLTTAASRPVKKRAV